MPKILPPPPPPIFFTIISTCITKDNAVKLSSKLYVYFHRKVRNKSHNLIYCYSLQPKVVYNFREIEYIFPVPSWGYVADYLYIRGLVPFPKKDKYNIFRHGEILLDLLIFTLYLLQSVCCSKYSAKTTIFLSFIFFFISCIAFYWNICSEFFLLKYNLNSNFL